jgi:hypothetical protein
MAIGMGEALPSMVSEKRLPIGGWGLNPWKGRGSIAIRKKR